MKIYHSWQMASMFNCVAYVKQWKVKPYTTDWKYD